MQRDVQTWALELPESCDGNILSSSCVALNILLMQYCLASVASESAYCQTFSLCYLHINGWWCSGQVPPVCVCLPFLYQNLLQVVLLDGYLWNWGAFLGSFFVHGKLTQEPRAITETMWSCWHCSLV